MSFSEDLAPYFSDFGEAVVIGGVPGVGLFDEAFRVVLEDSVASSGPALTIRQADFAPALMGAPVVVRQLNYSVVGVEPDGTGVALLRLERV